MPPTSPSTARRPPALAWFCSTVLWACGFLACGVAAGQEAAAMRGRVVDRAGEPVSGATVTWTDDLYSNQESVTPADGGFRLLYLPPMPSMVEVRAEGFVTRAVQLAARADEPRAQGVEIVLYRPSFVVGRVVDPEGRPVAGADVRLDAQGEARVSLTRENRTLGTTGPKGEFELAYTRPGPYQVTASDSELAPVLGPVIRLEAKGERFDVGEVRLEPGVVFEGRVTDPEGAALRGVQVSARPKPAALDAWYFTGLRYERQAQTGETGRFRLHGLRAGDPIVVRLSKAGWASRELEISWPFDEPAVLVMEPGLELRGRVRDAAGRPVAGALVIPSVDGAPVVGRSVESDEDGRFLIEDLPRGELTLRVQAPGGVPRVEHGPRPLTRSESLEIVLPAAGRLELRGTVVDSKGDPVAGAQVRCGPCPRSARDVTGVDGRFVLSALPAGEVRLSVDHPTRGQFGHRLVMGPGTSSVELRYRGVGVAGRVVDAESGRGVVDASVRLVPEKGFDPPPGIPERSLGDGTWRALNIGPGRYSAQVLHGSFAPYRSAPFEVGSVDDVDLGEIRLVVGPSITVRVRGPEGRDLSMLRAGLVSETGGLRFGLLEADGSARFEHLTPGEWTVYLKERDETLAEGPLVLLEGATRHVVVELVVD